MIAESYIKIQKLTAQDGEPIEDILQRGVDELHGLGEKATLELRLIGAADSNAKSVYSMQFTPEGASLHTERLTNPTLVVITTLSAFHDIAEGSYSPLQAYLDGKLKLQGNVELGRRITQHLKASGTQTACASCPCLTFVSWQLDEPQSGSLILSGSFFTPSGTVEIVYDYGSDQDQRLVVADPGDWPQGGAFAVTQPYLPCQTGVGVTVTATDLSNGQYTTLNCSTPC